MSKQEIRIVTKIVSELTLFFMMHGHKAIKMETYHEDDATLFVISVKRLENDLITKIRHKIERERELEIETYGWELIGDIDDKSELEIVGHLIDEMHVKQTDDKTILTFVRANRYKERKSPHKHKQ